MNPEVDHYDRPAEPADRFHPDHDSFLGWLDAEAPADDGQKLRNRPRWTDVAKRGSNAARRHEDPT